MQEIKKLYRAGSLFANSNGNDGIWVEWYNADIKISAVNYEDIIKDFSKMPSKVKMVAIKCVDEFFTYDQIELLGKFVKEELGTELMFEEFPLPIATHSMIEDYVEVILGFGEIEDMEGNNTIQLNKLENYYLPFKVNGFYLQDDSRPSNEILEKLKTNYNIPDNQILTGAYLDTGAIHRLLEETASGRICCCNNCLSCWLGCNVI